MKASELIRLFIPPVVLSIKNAISNLKKPEPSPLMPIDKGTDQVIILGNGPSLNVSVDKYIDIIKNNDRIAVNFFGSSDLYEKIQPNLYVFADPAFFFIPENQKESVTVLFENIRSKTTWPLQIVIPIGAKGAPIENCLLQNPNIKIIYYFNGTQNIGRLSKFEAWDRNLIGPPAQNVLNVCIYLALFWKYPEIYLVGADSSFLEDIRVDQETNELFSIDSHFYKQEKVYSKSDKNLFDPKRGRIKKDRTVGVLVGLYSKMFLYYEELRKYADYRGQKVYNASEYSWIDCFERKKLESIR